MVVCEEESYTGSWRLEEDLRILLSEVIGEGTANARTFPSVTVRRVSMSSSHVSVPCVFRMSSSHSYACSTIAWIAAFSCPCFLLSELMLLLSSLKFRAL